ncbi:CbtA family protein [Pseudomonas panipatensis]|uniref:CbtA family protein n=1 Tax=Pseudomonas panipatensis TaxID=428992 RepID=UPI0035AE3DAB
MTGTLLLRGMLVGILAGLLAFAFAKVYGEPEVARAIAFEEQGSAHHQASEASGAHAHADEEELVSREVQAGLGLLTGVLVYSSAMGGLFALVFAYALGRVGRLGPRALAALLALAAFIALYLVPGLKYPANPPSVGDPASIRQRTLLFFLMIAVSLAAAAVAVNLARRLIARHGVWFGALAGVALYLVICAVTAAVFPAVREVPADFPADLLWQFRVVALGIQAILWSTLGLAFGWWIERSLIRQGQYVPA